MTTLRAGRPTREVATARGSRGLCSAASLLLQAREGGQVTIQWLSQSNNSCSPESSCRQHRMRSRRDRQPPPAAALPPAARVTNMTAYSAAAVCLPASSGCALFCDLQRPASVPDGLRPTFRLVGLPSDSPYQCLQNSWNFYHCSISDAVMRGAALTMNTSGLAAAGYVHVNS
jgi:hypothetical protein